MWSANAAAMASSRRTMPSATEYSLCRRRWTNCGALMMLQFYRRFLPASDEKFLPAPALVVRPFPAVCGCTGRLREHVAPAGRHCAADRQQQSESACECELVRVSIGIPPG